MIRNILLDLDDTVFDFKMSERRAISVIADFGISPTEEVIRRYSEINDAQWKRLEKKEITREQVLFGRFEILFSEMGVDAPIAQVKAAYESLLSETYFFIPGAPELLEALSEKYSLYLATNGTASVQWGRIASSGIEKYFKGIFISQEIGYDKPAREYFEECFKRMEGFTRDTAIIVGDSLSSDIAGGINAGIATCLFNPRRKENISRIKPDYEIFSLGELPGLLESI